MHLFQAISILLLIFASVLTIHGIQIGILEREAFIFVNFSASGNQTNLIVEYLQITQNLQTQIGYNAARNQLTGYDIIIGKYSYPIATLCRNLTLPYYVTDMYFDTWPDPLMDSGRHPTSYATYIRHLSFLLSSTSIRFISDSSAYALDVLRGLSDQNILQCNMLSSSSDLDISKCFQSTFQTFQPQALYIITVDYDNVTKINNFMEQLLLQSLQFQSTILFVSSWILSTINTYSNTGADIYMVSQIPESITNYNPDILNKNVKDSVDIIQKQLSTYTKLSDGTYFSNATGVITLNKKVLLMILKTAPATGSIPLRVKQFYEFDVKKNRTHSSSNLVYDGTWTVNRLKFNNTVKAGFYQDKLFVSILVTGSGTVLSGYMVDLLNFLMKPLSIDFVIDEIPDVKSVGRKINFNYTGLLGSLLKKEANIIAFPVPLISAYRADFTYSEKIFDVKFSMLIKKATKKLDLLKFVKPYSNLVWLMAVVIIVVLGIILFLTNLISPNMTKDTDDLNIGNSIFYTIGSFLMAKILVKPNMFSTQLFYLLMWLGALLLIASYVANLTVMIAFETNQLHTFTTFDKLNVDKGDYKFIFEKDSFLHSMILSEIESNVTTQSVYVRLYNYAKQNWPNEYIRNTTDIVEYLLNNSNVGLLNDDIHNMYYSLRFCNLTTIVDNTALFSYAFVMREDFQYSKVLAQRIILLRESGITRNLENKYFRLGKCTTDVQIVSAVQALSIQDVAGIFLLIGVGLVFAFPVALIEYLLKKTQLDCQRNCTGTTLEFGTVYSAKVTSLDKKGIYVEVGNGLNCPCFDTSIYYIPKANLCGKGNKKEEVPSPSEQGIMIGTKLKLRYDGNDPEDSRRRFVQVNK